MLGLASHFTLKPTSLFSITEPLISPWKSVGVFAWVKLVSVPSPACVTLRRLPLLNQTL